MSKKIKRTIILAIAISFIGLGIFCYFRSIHMPTWMTYPYDVTIEKGNARINKYLSEETEIEIPKRIWWAKVSSIDGYAFEDLGTSINIKKIPEGKISTLEIYHQESQSYYQLFQNEAEMLRYTGNEKKVEIPEKVWGRSVVGIITDFSRFINSEVEEVIIPETVTYIGIVVFEDCKNLRQIDLPPQLKSIGVKAFSKSGIESIDIPKSVYGIGAGAFEYSYLKEMTGLENVEYIGNDPFRGTPWEENIEGDFVCFKDMLFLYRGNDEEVVVPSTVREIKGAFKREDEYSYPIKVKKVLVPDSVTLISAYSFSGQEGIEVYIPETVESIGDTGLNLHCDSVEEARKYSDIDTIFGSYDEVPGTIVTTAGSPAETYAIEEGVSYRIISKEEMQQEMEAVKKRQENK